MLRILCILLVGLLPFAAQAKMYKVVGEDGSITFTDIPPELEAKEYKPKGAGVNAVSNPQYNTEKLSLTLPYEDKNGTMLVQGSVNGVAMRFIVDTGATFLAIPPVIAKKAGLYDEPSQTVTAQTANGSVQVSKVSVRRLQVGNIKQRDITATIQRISETEPELGLLGMSFFNRYNMHIDHGKKEIRLTPK